jgi:hypothetical protein
MASPPLFSNANNCDHSFWVKKHWKNGKQIVFFCSEMFHWKNWFHIIIQSLYYFFFCYWLFLLCFWSRSTISLFAKVQRDVKLIWTWTWYDMIMWNGNMKGVLFLLFQVLTNNPDWSWRKSHQNQYWQYSFFQEGGLLLFLGCFFTWFFPIV